MGRNQKSMGTTSTGGKKATRWALRRQTKLARDDFGRGSLRGMERQARRDMERNSRLINGN